MEIFIKEIYEAFKPYILPSCIFVIILLIISIIIYYVSNTIKKK